MLRSTIGEITEIKVENITKKNLKKSYAMLNLDYLFRNAVCLIYPSLNSHGKTWTAYQLIMPDCHLFNFCRCSLI